MDRTDTHFIEAIFFLFFSVHDVLFQSGSDGSRPACQVGRPAYR